jgi:hypothetical protein
MLCASALAHAVAGAAVVQQVDVMLADRTPIAYVTIPGEVAQAGAALVRVVVTQIQNPAAVPVDVMVSLCWMQRHFRSCQGPIGSFSLFPSNQSGTFVVRLPREILLDTTGGQHEEKRELALEFRLDRSKHDRPSEPVALTIGRLLWAQENE